MTNKIRDRRWAIAKNFIESLAVGMLSVVIVGVCFTAAHAQARGQSNEPGAVGEPYPDMPSIAPIGARTGKYLEVPASAQGPSIDPAKGYRLQNFGGGLYMITDNAIQSMFLVYDQGVVVMDAPQTLAAFILKAIAEVTNKPITYIIYSHCHADHIGGVTALHSHAPVIAHEETLRLLKRDADPNRPLPTITFVDKYTLKVGNQVL
jgi:hypothetical protein